MFVLAAVVPDNPAGPGIVSPIASGHAREARFAGRCRFQQQFSKVENRVSRRNLHHLP